MQYRNCIDAGQAAAKPSDGAAFGLADANINPITGLATDYLNHFNEAIMLLEMLSSCPECREDFLNWRPVSYREHFLASHFKARDMAIAAYDAADPHVRECLDTLARTMTEVLEATRSTLTGGMLPSAAGALAKQAAARLKVLVARAGAVINGRVEADPLATPQAVVDRLMRQSA